MDSLTFVSSLVHSLSWPVAFLVLAILLRKPLSSLLPHLKNIRYGQVELDFSSELQNLEDRARTAGLPISKRVALPDSQHRTAEDTIIDAARLADDFPAPAVGVAWLAIEHELMQAVMRSGISPDYPPYNAAIKNIALLHEQGCIDGDTRRILERMRRLRNTAVHASRDDATITSAGAREFASLADAVTTRLKRVKR